MSNLETQVPGVLIFQSLPPCIGNERNTSFATVPTIVTANNALEVYRYDYSPIEFTNGYRTGKNFKRAFSIPADFDNTHSDNPAYWHTFESLYQTFAGYGFNFFLHSSRNDNRIKKDKNGNEKIARRKAHIDFPLSKPVYDPEEFVAYCDWLIKFFKSDPLVKMRSQQIFGHGDHPNPTIKIFMGGKCIDQILTDNDLSLASPTHNTQKRNNITKTITPPPAATPVPIKCNNAFDGFAKSGEWRNHLGDLRNWRFFEQNGVVYFQTPEGDHSFGKHDGNIKNNVAFFHSKAPLPFENNKGYSIPKLFAGALFGDVGKEGLAKFANRYLS